MTSRPVLFSVALVAAVATGAVRAGAEPQAQAPAQSTPSVTAPAEPAGAPSIPRWARVSFFAQGASTTGPDGSSSSSSELVTNIAAQSVQHGGSGFEYGIDARFGAYPSAGARDSRASIYDAYVARRMSDGRVLVKAGQMWLNDLGGLGSVGGALVEFRQRAGSTRLRWRAGAFGGGEPEILDVGVRPGHQEARRGTLRSMATAPSATWWATSTSGTRTSPSGPSCP